MTEESVHICEKFEWLSLYPELNQRLLKIF